MAEGAAASVSRIFNPLNRVESTRCAPSPDLAVIPTPLSRPSVSGFHILSSAAVLTNLLAHPYAARHYLRRFRSIDHDHSGRASQLEREPLGPFLQPDQVIHRQGFQRSAEPFRIGVTEPDRLQGKADIGMAVARVGPGRPLDEG